MLYAGEEYSSNKKPSLFEKDVYNKNTDIQEFISKLSKLKKKSIFAKGIFNINIPEVDGVAYNTVENDKEKYVGIFNVGLVKGDLEVKLNDGKYRNYLTKKIVTVKNSKVKLREEPIIFRIRK